MMTLKNPKLSQEKYEEIILKLFSLKANNKNGNNDNKIKEIKDELRKYGIEEE